MGGFGELADGYTQLRTIRAKSVPVADDGVDRARWGHSTALRPVSRQMPILSASTSGLDGLPQEGILWEC